MKLEEIVHFWSQQCQNAQGQWTHPADDPFFQSAPHSFNLDFPVSPYVGDILNAPVIILGANAGYDPQLTPTEFPDAETIERYVARVGAPSAADWGFVSEYYGGVNYGPLLADGRAALINACPYRSPKISAEPENRSLLARLPSTSLTRRWLLEAVVPLARAGRRLIVAKRPGLWKLPASLREMEGVVFDPAPISPQITSGPWATVQATLRAL
jgi:hypothetical protein